MNYRYNLSFSLSLLLMGFLLANIFGILTNNKNVIFFFVLFIEIINYFAYNKQSYLNLALQDRCKAPPNTMTFLHDRGRRKFCNFRLHRVAEGDVALKSILYNKNLWKDKKKILSLIISIIVSSLNFLKVGFEFGFFIDAFKLGS